MNKSILIIGAPGTGKGTFAQKLVEDFNVIHIATGNLFRDNISNKTTIGKKALKFMDKGILVPDEITDEMVKSRLANSDIKDSIILLDGYPRNIHQGKKIIELLKEINRNIDFIILLISPDEILIQRVINRRLCRDCGYVYNTKDLSTKPIVKGKCNKCKGLLYQRKDDNKEFITKRLEEYNQVTIPLVNFFQNKVDIIKFDTSKQNINEVYLEITRELYKNSDKLKNMAKAGKVAALVQGHCQKIIKPGLNLLDLDKACQKVIEDNGATPAFMGIYDYNFSTCLAVNEVVVHGTPINYTLQKGDIVTVDVGAKVNGWNSDTAVSYAVGPISHDKQKLIDVTKEALNQALAVVKEGVRVGDISSAICSYVYKNNMAIPEEFSGHGIGRSLHEAPYVPNIGKPNTGDVLKAGDTIAIEPIVIFGKKEIELKKEDGFTAVSKDKTPAAHFEHTIEITQDGYKILTSLDQREVKNG